MVMLCPDPRSPRGIDLVHTVARPNHPVLTCELHTKWYQLFLIHPDGRVEPADLDGLEDLWPGTVVGDHCWNPSALEYLAEARGWVIDPVAFDLIAGRWVANHMVEL